MIIRAKYWGKSGEPRLRLLRTFIANRSDEIGSPVIGAGLDWSLGDQFTAGINAGGSLRELNQIQTIEAGVHIGWVLAP